MALPQRADRIFLDVMAEIAVKTDDGNTIAADQRTGGGAQRFHDIFETLGTSHRCDRLIQRRQGCRDFQSFDFDGSDFNRDRHGFTPAWGKSGSSPSRPRPISLRTIE